MVVANHDTGKPATSVGRPRIVLPKHKAAVALWLLSQRKITFCEMVRVLGVKRLWLSKAFHDGRLHEMAGQRAGGEILRPSSFIFIHLIENLPDGAEW